MIKLSIIILSFNTKKLTVQCIQSLLKNYKNEIDNKEIEIIVADNNSQDHTVEELQKIHGIVVIQNKENLGFSKGNNVASQKAKGENLLFLNSDTTVEDRGIIGMVDVFKNRKDIGILGGCLTDEYNNKQKSAGHFYNLIHISLMLFTGSKINTSRFVPKSFQEVDWVEGSFLAIRNDLFKKLNGFDENFFMYVEDVDLCYRAKKAGFKTAFYPESSAIHVGQGSSNKTFAIVNIYKGIAYFYKKHKNRAEYNMIKMLLSIKAIISIIIGIISGNKYLTQTYKQALLGIL